MQGEESSILPSFSTLSSDLLWIITCQDMHLVHRVKISVDNPPVCWLGCLLGLSLYRLSSCQKCGAQLCRCKNITMVVSTDSLCNFNKKISHSLGYHNYSQCTHTALCSNNTVERSLSNWLHLSVSRCKQTPSGK